jgi:ribosome-binding factor A
MHHRDKRVADAIKDTVAEIITNEIADPKVGFVTVTRCHITRDLKHATVFFTVMGDEIQQKQATAHLGRAAGYIRHRLGQKVKFRYLPELKFALDDVVAHELRINEIIAGMHGNDATGDEPPGD